jgi:hypothetical protein
VSTRTIRCVACARRIRASHPHIGVEDYDTRAEFNYHARPECQERAMEETEARIQRGKVYMVHHYHVCGDEAAGFDCRGGCFSGLGLPEAS